MSEGTPNDRNWNLLFGAWVIVTGATLGSLFFSEIMDLPPCSLCWYQRIFMYPLVPVLLAGLFPYDPKVIRYALPLAVGGLLTAIYHSLLHLGVIPESAAPCGPGVSCSEAYLSIFGFISIPVLSLLAFGAIVAMLITVKRSSNP